MELHDLCHRQYENDPIFDICSLLSFPDKYERNWKKSMENVQISVTSYPQTEKMTYVGSRSCVFVERRNGSLRIWE